MVWTLDFGLWTLDFQLVPLIFPGMLFLRAVQFWIILSTLASVAGWTLSAIGMLNRTGYTIFAAVALLTVFFFSEIFFVFFCSGRREITPPPAPIFAGGLRDSRRARFY